MNLQLVIEEITKKISARIPYINSGGCIHFAYFLSLELSKRNIKHDIAVIDRYYSQDEYKTYKSKIRNCGCSHVYIKIDNFGLIDGEGITTFETIKTRYFPGDFTAYYSLSEINYLRQIPDSWNDLYNRKNNRLLSQIIKQSFYSNGY